MAADLMNTPPECAPFIAELVRAGTVPSCSVLARAPFDATRDALEDISCECYRSVRRNVDKVIETFKFVSGARV